jgi:hypothetical protein
VAALRKVARHDEVAEVAAWNVVKAAPRAAERGVGFVLTTVGATPAKAAAAPKPAPKPKQR